MAALKPPHPHPTFPHHVLKMDFTGLQTCRDYTEPCLSLCFCFKMCCGHITANSKLVASPMWTLLVMLLGVRRFHGVYSTAATHALAFISCGCLHLHIDFASAVASLALSVCCQSHSYITSSMTYGNVCEC